MSAFVGLLLLSVIGVVVNQSHHPDTDNDEGEYSGPFAGIIDSFTGNIPDNIEHGAGRTFLNFFGNSNNKPCNLTNALGYGNATCTIYCLITGFQLGGICSRDGYCTCIS
ncbi:uncharacterized protein LOC119646358 [Hermetia illucens]|uniref:uncharacterized protein LOC119646358 n=1 Tax=Hermetia illucens TaxID=343691 RepID=UPI0018CC585F|nr:uncharacterized protein LOC119646358 [Hermetia illucens]